MAGTSVYGIIHRIFKTYIYILYTYVNKIHIFNYLYIFTYICIKTATLGPEMMMFTSDVALLHDPEGIYQDLVKLYLKDLNALNYDFAHAWYKLTR
jgi:hypothetical protein